ncbi:glycoprotein [Rhinolophus gammaherpesvirus 1]|uniref:Glycoprotein n=1 Tax=Rhinolophus gammaherpesvirus 1 TaxID=2054179 RepID=A0A2Z5U6A1_9GAMA|nr:glycoprotein [Rhinolophus gammaherpesvirus 1]BBB06464.1 glycoprotein [Rhinolophus gammaherpesvirus 1]
MANLINNPITCDYTFNSTITFILSYTFWVTIPSPKYVIYPDCTTCRYTADLSVAWEKITGNVRTVESENVALCEISNCTSLTNTHTDKKNNNYTLEPIGKKGFFNVYTYSHKSTDNKDVPKTYVSRVLDPFNISWCHIAYPQSVTLPMHPKPDFHNSCTNTSEILNIVDGITVINISRVLVDSTTGGKIDLIVQGEFPIRCTISISASSLKKDATVFSSHCLHTLNIQVSSTNNSVLENGNYITSMKLTILGITKLMKPSLIMYSLSVRNNNPYSCQAYTNITIRETQFQHKPSHIKTPMFVPYSKSYINHYVYPKEYQSLPINSIFHAGIYRPDDPKLTCKMKFIKRAHQATSQNIQVPSSHCYENVSLEWTRVGEIIFKFASPPLKNETYIAFIHSTEHHELYTLTFVNSTLKPQVASSGTRRAIRVTREGYHLLNSDMHTLSTGVDYIQTGNDDVITRVGEAVSDPLSVRSTRSMIRGSTSSTINLSHNTDRRGRDVAQTTDVDGQLSSGRAVRSTAESVFSKRATTAHLTTQVVFSYTSPNLKYPVTFSLPKSHPRSVYPPQSTNKNFLPPPKSTVFRKSGGPLDVFSVDFRGPHFVMFFLVPVLMLIPFTLFFYLYTDS